MNWKRFGLATLATLVLVMGLGFLGHGVFMQGDYDATKELWRPQEMMNETMAGLFLWQIGFALLFTYMFTQSRREEGLAEGFRFGFVMGLFYFGLSSVMDFWATPVPGALAAADFLIGFITSILSGLAVAAIYRPKEC